MVGGPTASGKTNLAISLAQEFKTEIISADSRQFYKELSIGVAKPSEKELKSVKHHFIGQLSIRDSYSAGMFERDVLTLLENLFSKHDVVIMAGGSGLFIQAVLNGFHESVKDDGSVRKFLELELEKQGIEVLQNRLKTLDPEDARQVDLNNPQRLIRALELIQLTGKTKKERTRAQLAKRPFNTIEIAIEHQREVLYKRINTRVDDMMKAGLLNEVRGLTAFKHLNALQTVGYSELFNHLDGENSLDEAVEKIKQNTRRYAKRQITWFKNKTQTQWFPPETLDVLPQFLKDQMGRK